MDKNLQLAKEVLGKVELKLINKEYKEIKLIISSYFRLIKISILNKFKVTDEEFAYYMSLKNTLDEYFNKAQVLLEEEINKDNFQEAHALTYIVEDLQRAIRDIEFQKSHKDRENKHKLNKALPQYRNEQQ